MQYPSIPLTIAADSVYTGSGSIGISSSITDFSVVVAYSNEFSWRIEGFVEKGFDSSWSVGDGEYHWYRIEGECGSVECDTFGVQHRNCNRMTFVNVVAARNAAEVCEILQNPSINPPVNVKVTSIKRYSRPVLRSAATRDDCNILEDEYFCQIPECMDYCIDERVVMDIPVRVFSIDGIYKADMSGGLRLGGRADNSALRNFTPQFPIIFFTGSCSASIKYILYGDYNSMGFAKLDLGDTVSELSTENSIQIGGSSPFTSSFYYFEPLGSLTVGGNSRNISSAWTINPSGTIRFGGEFPLGYTAEAGGQFGFDGTFLSKMILKYDATGKESMFLQGSGSDISSPFYYYQPASGVGLLGDAGLNFSDMGIVSVNFGIASSVFGFSSDFDSLNYGSDLTISNSSVSPSCGCSPVSLALSLRHNLSKSSVFNDFINRAGVNFDSLSYLRYKSADTSWHDVRLFSGVGGSGSSEDISIISTLSCMVNFWRFSFVVRRVGADIGGLETKFIMDMPASLMCGDNNISTKISLDIQSGSFNVSRGKQIYVVTPHSIRPKPKKAYRGATAFVDGVLSEYAVYYDEIGLFKNDYWSKFPFELEINTVLKTEMPVMDLQRIF